MRHTFFSSDAKVREQKANEGEVKTGKWVVYSGTDIRPTKDNAVELKNSFYDSLEDQLVVMCVFNGRVGRDVTTWGGVVGRYGEEITNRNGPKLLFLFFSLFH